MAYALSDKIKSHHPWMTLIVSPVTETVHTA